MHSAFSMSHCRGYLVSWDVEKPVWWRAFKNMLQQQPQDCGLLMTEAPFCLPSIQTSTMQVTALNICLLNTCTLFERRAFKLCKHCTSTQQRSLWRVLAMKGAYH
jgi:hypothetical protein